MTPIYLPDSDTTRPAWLALTGDMWLMSAPLTAVGQAPRDYFGHDHMEPCKKKILHFICHHSVLLELGFLMYGTSKSSNQEAEELHQKAAEMGLAPRDSFQNAFERFGGLI